MDKMKIQDAQLMQTSGDATSTINDQSSVMALLPQPIAQIAKAVVLAGSAGPQEWNHSHPQLCTNQQAQV